MGGRGKGGVAMGKRERPWLPGIYTHVVGHYICIYIFLIVSKVYMVSMVQETQECQVISTTHTLDF